MIARVRSLSWSHALLLAMAGCTDVAEQSLGALPLPRPLPARDAEVVAEPPEVIDASSDSGEPGQTDAGDLVPDAGETPDAASDAFSDKPCCRNLAARFDASVARCDEMLCRSLPPPPPNNGGFP